MAIAIEQKFARLLAEGVHQISLRESKPIQIVQDELGHALGRTGRSAIEYWRKGHIPPSPADVAALAREIVKRGHVEREWLEQFLCSAGYPNSADLVLELFPHLLHKAQTDPLKSEHALRARSGRTDPAWDDDSSINAPFIIGPPITHPRSFFGREYELKRIFDVWKPRPLQNIAVIGAQRSGKTSLLHYLQTITTVPPERLRPGQRTNWLPHPERYRWVFVDFQDARMLNRERLLGHLLTSLQMPTPSPCDLHGFMDVVSQHLRTPAVVLMDEVGIALAAPELDQYFWWGLRSLGSHQTGGNLGFLLTCHEPLAQLAQAQGKPSPFFNIFGHSFTLGPLTEAEARELIASSPEPFGPMDTEWILKHSGRWPCLLQILCYARLTALQDGETHTAWQQRGLGQILPFQHLLEPGT